MINLFGGQSLDVGWGLAWLTVGLIFGCLAVSIIGRGGYGVVGDGLLLSGAMAGGLLLESLSNETAWLWGSLAVACLSACVLTGLPRLGTRHKTRPTGMTRHRFTMPGLRVRAVNANPRQ